MENNIFFRQFHIIRISLFVFKIERISPIDLKKKLFLKDVLNVACVFCFILKDIECSLMYNTWLILPVVICLPQGLSHASLSVSIYIVKLHTAHYISNYFFDGKHYYMDTRSNSRANTCVKFSVY